LKYFNFKAGETTHVIVRLASGLDLVLAPPPFSGSSVIDFDRHKEVFEAAYRACNGQIARLTQNAIQLSKPFLGPKPDDVTRGASE
jgi:predicted acylesterase/phospholipase RssA